MDRACLNIFNTHFRMYRTRQSKEKIWNEEACSLCHVVSGNWPALRHMVSLHFFVDDIIDVGSTCLRRIRAKRIKLLPSYSLECIWNPAAWNAASTEASSILYGTMPIDGLHLGFSFIPAHGLFQEAPRTQ